MLSGTKPFAGDSVVSITYAIMNTDPPKPSQCGAALWEVLRKALDKSPMMRYNSAQDMADGLRQAKLQDESPMSGYSGYLGSPVPQTVNPYLGTPAPNVNQPPVQPYNPYNPYQPPQQPQQTIIDPYANPYANQYGTGAYQQPPGTMMPPQQFPAFYPPPPKQPLLKPETVDFFKRLTIAFLVIGTLFAMLMLGVLLVSRTLQDYSAERQDASVSMTMPNDPNVPVAERIEKAIQVRSQFRSERRIREADRHISALYIEMGTQAKERNNQETAEAHFLTALEFDDRSAPAHAQLGSLYERWAQFQEDAVRQLNLWQQAGGHWRDAHLLETDPGLRAKYGDGAAVSYYNAAFTAMGANIGDRQFVRQMLYEAKTYASTGSQVQQQVDMLLNRVLGG
jgi:eukaryotic-like serine/threonine-protein kinase